MLTVQCQRAQMFQSRAERRSRIDGINAIIQEVSRPSLVLFASNIVPGPVRLRYGLVPTPILDERRRGAQQIERAIQCSYRFGNRECALPRPGVKNIIQDPILVEPA